MVFAMVMAFVNVMKALRASTVTTALLQEIIPIVAVSNLINGVNVLTNTSF